MFSDLKENNKRASQRVTSFSRTRPFHCLYDFFQRNVEVIKRFEFHCIESTLHTLTFLESRSNAPDAQVECFQLTIIIPSIQKEHVRSLSLSYYVPVCELKILLYLLHIMFFHPCFSYIFSTSSLFTQEMIF